MSKFVVIIDGHRYEVELPYTLSNQLRRDVSAERLFPVAQQDSADRQYSAAHSILVDGLPVEVIFPGMGDSTEPVQWLIVNDRLIETTIDPNMRWIKSPWGVHTLEVRDLDTTMTPLHTGFKDNGKGMAGNDHASNGRIKAPIPGLIIQVRISTGESVEAGQPMFILEAMKMENEIRAPRSGIIKSINVSLGQGVFLNQVLAEID